MSSNIKLTFLEVGHGDSIVITYPDQVTATIIDTPNSKITYDYIVKQGIQYIDWVFISHGDIDHYRGIVGLINNLISNGIPVANLGYIPGDKHLSRDTSYQRLRRNFVDFEDRHNVNTVPPYSCTLKDVVNVDNMIIQCIYPHSAADVDAAGGEANNWSIVLMVQYEGFRVLLPGDLEGKGWFRLVTKCKSLKTSIKADILKLPHHGSWFDTGINSLSVEEVVSEVDATIGILSLGFNKKFTFPAPKTIRALRTKRIRIMCTGSGSSCHDGKSLYGITSPILLTRPESLDYTPCAGTIEVEIRPGSINILPLEDDHNLLKSNLKTPLC